MLLFTVDVNEVTEDAEAKLAVAIAELACDVTAVDNTPCIPVTFLFASCVNTASSLSKSVATAVVAVLTVEVICVDNASATPVILVPL